MPTVKELRKIASGLKIPGRSKMNKAALITAISASRKRKSKSRKRKSKSKSHKRKSKQWGYLKIILMGRVTQTPTAPPRRAFPYAPLAFLLGP